MKNISSDNDSFSNFTTILRILSGQDVEPEFVLVEHAYALPWSSESEKGSPRPSKTLFFDKLSPSIDSKCSIEENINVDTESPSIPTLYDLQKGCNLMKESEKHINAKLNLQGLVKGNNDSQDSEEDDWEEKVDKFGWSDSQKDLFSCTVNVLNGLQLAKLSLQGAHNEPVKRRAQTDIAAGKLRQILGRNRWDMKLCSWLHNILVYNMNKTFLASYIDILQTLNSSIPKLIEKMTALPPNYKGPIVEDLNLFLKRAWDPVSSIFNKFKPSKMDSPIVIQVPSGLPPHQVPMLSRRFRFFNSQLQHMVKFVTVSVSSELTKADEILNYIASETRTKIVECKAQHPSRPVILLGWGAGASLAANISLIEKVSGLICLGFPFMDHDGKRGEGDDPLMDLNTPSLFVIGGKATNVHMDDLEYFRYQLPCTSSLIKIDGADALLRISSQKCYEQSISQSIVDRCIVDEIGTFLKQTLSDDNNNKTSSSMGSFTNPLPPRVSRKDVSRKRKLSPTASDTQSPKISKLTESRLSHNLGLKIPVSSSNSGKYDTQETYSSSTAGSFTGLELPSDSNRCKITSLADDSFHLGATSSDSAISKPNYPFEGSSTTFALGSLASLSNQKYQRMMKVSENSDSGSLDASSSHSNWKTSSATTATESPDIVGLNSALTNSSILSSRAPTSNFNDNSGVAETTDINGQPVVKFHQSTPTSGESSQILVTSSVSSNKPKKVPGRRGRPPGRTNRGGSAFRPVEAFRPKGDIESKNNASEKSSMAVLTLTGEGSSSESAGKGISSLGRGVLTLSRGGTSAVRVYSANSHKASNVSHSSGPKNSLLFTNLSSANPTEKVSGYQVSNMTSVRRMSTSSSPSGMMGISAARTAVSQRGGPGRSVNASRPTVVYLTGSSPLTDATTTTTTISSGGVKTTKSIVGVRQSSSSQQCPSFESSPDSFKNVITVEGSNTIHIPEPSNPEMHSELDILAEAATELYKKENLSQTDPSESEQASKTNTTTKSTFKIINANPINKNMIKYIPSFPIGKSDSTKNNSTIRLIKPVVGRTFLKTAAVGTTSTGQVITRTFTINPNNMEMSLNQSPRLSLDAVKEDKSFNTEAAVAQTSTSGFGQQKVVITTNSSSGSQTTATKSMVRVSTSIAVDKNMLGNLSSEGSNPVIKVTSLSSSVKVNQNSPIIKLATIATTSSGSPLMYDKSSPSIRLRTTTTTAVSSSNRTVLSKTALGTVIKAPVLSSSSHTIADAETSTSAVGQIDEAFSTKPLIKVSTNTPVAKAVISKPSIKVLTPKATSEGESSTTTPVRGITAGRVSLMDHRFTRSTSKSPNRSDK